MLGAWTEGRSFGFIIDNLTGSKLFVHNNEFQEICEVGNPVEYDVEFVPSRFVRGKKRFYRAARVRRARPALPPGPPPSRLLPERRGPAQVITVEASGDGQGQDKGGRISEQGASAPVGDCVGAVSTMGRKSGLFLDI